VVVITLGSSAIQGYPAVGEWVQRVSEDETRESPGSKGGDALADRHDDAVPANVKQEDNILA